MLSKYLTDIKNVSAGRKIIKRIWLTYAKALWTLEYDVGLYMSMLFPKEQELQAKCNQTKIDAMAKMPTKS